MKIYRLSCRHKKQNYVRQKSALPVTHETAAAGVRPSKQTVYRPGLRSPCAKPLKILDILAMWLGLKIIF